ncbi:hypothetical protein FRC02_005937 [Tulasnella sp. 418]|nr:hypothetical protein FRC02_005937 [Tulasnella sp. 418]
MAILVRHGTARPMMEIESGPTDCPQGLTLRISKEIARTIETEWSGKLETDAKWRRNNVPAGDIVNQRNTRGLACQYALSIKDHIVAIAELFIYKKSCDVTEFEERKKELSQAKALYGVLRKTAVASPGGVLLRQKEQFLWIIRNPDIQYDHVIGSNGSEGTDQMEIDSEEDTPEDLEAVDILRNLRSSVA